MHVLLTEAETPRFAGKMTGPGYRWERSPRPDEVVPTEPLTRREPAGNAVLLDCEAALSPVWTVVRVLSREPAGRGGPRVLSALGTAERAHQADVLPGVPQSMLKP
ncbi:hypothetical protein [Amycolatopsis sp. NPDC004378]